MDPGGPDIFGGKAPFGGAAKAPFSGAAPGPGGILFIGGPKLLFIGGPFTPLTLEHERNTV